MVAFRDELFSDGTNAYSVQEELPRLALRDFRDVGVHVIPPVVDRPVRRIKDGLVCKDKRMDEVSVFPWPICDPPIHIGMGNMDFIAW